MNKSTSLSYMNEGNFVPHVKVSEDDDARGVALRGMHAFAHIRRDHTIHLQSSTILFVS